jgi:hypothetical protein
MTIRPAMTEIEWDHPNAGTLKEGLCPQHVKDVLGAIQALGMGCIAKPVRDGRDCERCMAEFRGTALRDYVRRLGGR